jgi:putative redox protein
MDTFVTLLDHMAFRAVSDSGHEVRIDTGPDSGGEDSAARPMELVAMALGSCTGMDVISILRKKRQEVTGFEVRLHLERAEAHPKIFNSALIEYSVSGRGLDEAAVMRAIQLSVEKYCPVHAMLSRVFPMELCYRIQDEAGNLIKQGACEPEFV